MPEPGPVPVPASAPEPSVRACRDLLSRTALGVFRLNGRFLAVSEELARPAGLTAARGQVLGAVLREPLPVAGIARVMGITRQSVQRVADLLAADGLAEYVPNPAHRRAKLLRPTEEGRAAITRIAPGHAALAGRLAEELGEEAFAETVRTLERLSAALDALGPPDVVGPPDVDGAPDAVDGLGARETGR
ncbi:MarR family winged helix-turn-helix transcriptional regulator [Streptomyces sp. A1136]|uniref:MarR family winged helix-turn-helix transcriptional regulator n=1 Tax=Streptomyces sp. A1136 TaxID=2563102 RepID=UPI00109E3F80|nr:MarR family winged helix-turn-helix transcriptional regulator [Streptomyces sp. A1136]THA45406.1 MarR family transcriptional regulator [Streptomyces sp. A1136]